jgi:hypothetical protein
VARAAASAAISSQIRRSASGSTPRPGSSSNSSVGSVEQDARDLDAPAHPARIRRRGLVGAVAQRHQRQRLVDAPGRRARAGRRTARRRAAGSRARSASDRGWPPGTRRPNARGRRCRPSTPAVRRAPASRRAPAATRPAGGTPSSCRRRWARAGRTARPARPRS